MHSKDNNSLASRIRRNSDKLQLYALRLQRLLRKEIWELEHLGRRTVRARIYHLLRILTLTAQGLKRNQIPMQSAALTFYSSIGIGPIIAFGIMISGFLIDRDIADPSADPHESVVVRKITQVITFAAPQVSVTVNGDSPNQTGTELAPELLELISNFSSVAKSGTVGVIGTLVLLFICLRVLTSIESSFNTLWGVEKGRNFTERIVTYWTFISLGALIGSAAISLQILNVFISFAENLPFGTSITAIIQFFLPLLTVIMITLLLAAFLRFIPNTQVKWKPALLGALLVVTLLQIYKTLSFLYVQQVVSNNSLYGSVGIIVVLMLGLYVFWLLILLGGQVTYAVQNADFLTNENAWQKTSERARELISLSVLLIVMKRFKSGHPPVKTSELLKKLRVPSHILNTSIHRLCTIGYLYQIEDHNAEEERDHAYQPGCPPENISLAEFKQSIETFGNDEGSNIAASTDPATRIYIDEVLSLKNCPKSEMTLADLIQLKDSPN
ncbi:YihY/virulence factor BrkB family protein [Coraliomargarita sp. SDUM461004]|uniref:YihY/virulence factor BrkB family protein n=1 Tax=Thalassobacterium sedimentorum TaxID=3041258 RepID=A0ABU1AEF5_9BACT|nr:YihY/virulence factor BrkB family protein [Coraliomargarita sp. SDUM461004]MDQ8193095.1 YihY/virulence factor BrkB family protein [Coraliomargarita sp. SDUM461004]